MKAYLQFGEGRGPFRTVQCHTFDNGSAGPRVKIGDEWGMRWRKIHDFGTDRDWVKVCGERVHCDVHCV